MLQYFFEDEKKNSRRNLSANFDEEGVSGVGEELKSAAPDNDDPLSMGALDFSKLVNNQSYSDMKITCQDGEFFLHKCLLFARCPRLLKVCQLHQWFQKLNCTRGITPKRYAEATSGGPISVA